MSNYPVNSELRKFKRSLSDLLSAKIVQKLTYEQKRDVHREVLARLFNLASPDAAKEANKDDKLLHFDLMKETLIKIGKLISDKFKQIDDLKNDDEEIKLIKVLSDAIDHPITLPYLIPNLCECTLSSIEILLKHFGGSQRVSEFEIDETFDKKLNDKITEKIDEKIKSSKQPQRASAESAKKVYKVYSNKTSEYYESKRVSGKTVDTSEDLRLKKKIDEIASESNKMHQLNQQYRRNREDLQDELISLKERYHKLVHESEEKSALIEEKQSQFEGLEIEVNTIKVQLESIYKQNQLLDSDKLHLSSNASNLQRRIDNLERLNRSSIEECAKLKEQLSKREEQIQRLERVIDEKRSSLDSQQLQIRRLIDEEQTMKRQFELLEMQEREIKFKYEKVIKDLELKQKALSKDAIDLKEEVDGLRSKLDDKTQENFRLNLDLKECSSKLENLKREKEEDEELIKSCREDKALLSKKLELNAQELSRFKKLNLESNKFIEDKTVEIEQLQADLTSARNENIEMTNKLASLQDEKTRQLELTKKSCSNELKQKVKLIDELKHSLNELKTKLDILNDEKKLFVRLFGYMENLSDPSQTLPTSLNEAPNQTDEEGAKVRQQSGLQLEQYLNLVKELKSEFKCRQLEVNRLKEANKLVENEYEEQRNFLQSIQQKLVSNSSQLKIKDCELIHLRDQLAECKTRRNEDELEKMNLMRESENLRNEKSGLELLKLELKQKITNCQLRNVELENQLQINLNKIIELERFINELNDKHQQLSTSLNETNERLVESSSARDQLARELNSALSRLQEREKLLLEEKSLNHRLNESNQQLAGDKSRLEKSCDQLKCDNQQLEFDLDRIEKEFKDYESRYRRLIDDRSWLTDLVSKYNIILKSHLSPSLQSDENCLEFTSHKTTLKLLKPEILLKSLLELQSEQSRLRRQTESLKMKVSEQRIKLKEENDQNQEFKALIEFNENNLLKKQMNYERLFREQKDFKVQLEQTLEENERLKIEKTYLTEKVLSLDKILGSVKDFMEKKFEETCAGEGERMPNKELDLNNHPSLNLEDLEARLIYMHDSLTEFINILMKKFGDYKEQVGQLNEANQALDARLSELNRALEKRKDKEHGLQQENESLKKELTASSHNSREVDSKVKRLTNQIAELQEECLTLQSSLESNR